MKYRIYYILTNKKIDVTEHEDFKIVLNESTEEKKLLFNEDILNVLTESEYKKALEQKYMYGFIITDFSNILKKIKTLFKYVFDNFDDVIIGLDSGSMRYLNSEELQYYSNNVMVVDKLFTIEVDSSEYFSVYRTKGLNTIIDEEIKMSTPKYYAKKDFKVFKDYVISNLTTNKFDLVMIREECLTVDYKEVLNYKLNYSKEYKILCNKHLVDNYKYFYKLYEKLKNNKEFEFEINNIKVNNEINTLPDYKKITYSNFEEFLKSYKIKHGDMVYDHINIFYATKYLK